MVLTFEFKADLTPEQKTLIDNWLKELRVIWNLGLNALEELDTFKGYAQSSGQFKEFAQGWQQDSTEGLSEKDTWIASQMEGMLFACCPLPWEKRLYWIKESGEIVDKQSEADARLFAPFSRLLSPSSRWYVKKLQRVKIPTGAEQKDTWGWKSDQHGCNGYSCPLPQEYRRPKLRSPSFKDSEGLGKIVTKAIDPQRFPELLKVPQRYRAGVIAALSTSWDEYIKARAGVAKLKRGKPKYKRQGQDELQTLILANPDKKSMVPIEDDWLKSVPGLGKIKIRGLNRRWKNPDGSIPAIDTLKICHRPSGWYVQLSGKIVRSTKVKPSDRVTAFDPGLKSFITLADGTNILPAKFFRKSEKTLARLQQKQALTLTHRLILWLHHPERQAEDIRRYCPGVSVEKAKQLIQCKSEKEMVVLVGSSVVNTLKYRALPPSKRSEQLKLKISRTHERIRLQRRNFNHKHSTFLVRNYGTIIAEDGMQSQNLRKRANPQLREDGKGYERNNAKAKSGLSKSLADASPGAFISMVENKSKSAGRNFQRYPAAYTTQECPVCEHRQEMSPDVRWYKCEQCGWECDRDQKSGILMIVKVLESGAIDRTGLPEVVQDTIRARAAWRDAHPPENARRGRCKNQGQEKKPRKPRRKGDSGDASK